jgi:cytochrome P450
MRFLNLSMLMTSDPENIKAILATSFESFGLGQRLRAFSPLLTGGIFVSDGPAWQHSRALVRPAFTRTQVADLDSFETHIQHFIAQLPIDGSTIDLGPLFYRLTFDQATEFLLGESVYSLTSPSDSIQQQFGTAFDLAQSKCGHLRTSGILSYIWPDRAFFRAVATTHAFVDGFVQKARAAVPAHEKGIDWKWDDAKHGRYVFLEELARATDDPVEMRNEVLSTLLAGRDTTASLLTSTFHAVARRPDVWARLRAEVEVLGGKVPDYETLKSLKYIKFVLNEGRTFFSPSPSLSLIS